MCAAPCGFRRHLLVWAYVLGLLPLFLRIFREKWSARCCPPLHLSGMPICSPKPCTSGPGRRASSMPALPFSLRIVGIVRLRRVVLGKNMLRGPRFVILLPIAIPPCHGTRPRPGFNWPSFSLVAHWQLLLGAHLGTPFPSCSAPYGQHGQAELEHSGEAGTSLGQRLSSSRPVSCPTCPRASPRGHHDLAMAPGIQLAVRSRLRNQTSRWFSTRHFT